MFESTFEISCKVISWIIFKANCLYIPVKWHISAFRGQAWRFKYREDIFISLICRYLLMYILKMCKQLESFPIKKKIRHFDKVYPLGLKSSGSSSLLWLWVNREFLTQGSWNTGKAFIERDLFRPAESKPGKVIVTLTL